MHKRISSNLFINSYRFLDLFPNANEVCEAQKELDSIIQQGVFQITRLLRNTDAKHEKSCGETTYVMKSISEIRGIVFVMK